MEGGRAGGLAREARGPRRLRLGSRHRGVRGDPARARRPCARRVLRRGGPAAPEGPSSPRACARPAPAAWRTVSAAAPRALAARGRSRGDARACSEPCCGPGRS